MTTKPRRPRVQLQKIWILAQTTNDGGSFMYLKKACFTEEDALDLMVIANDLSTGPSFAVVEVETWKPK